MPRRRKKKKRKENERAARCLSLKGVRKRGAVKEESTRGRNTESLSLCREREEGGEKNTAINARVYLSLFACSTLTLSRMQLARYMQLDLPRLRQRVFGMPRNSISFLSTGNFVSISKNSRAQINLMELRKLMSAFLISGGALFIISSFAKWHVIFSG